MCRGQCSFLHTSLAPVLTHFQAYINRNPSKYRMDAYPEDQIIKNTIHSFLKLYLNTAKGNFRKQVSRVIDFSPAVSDPIATWTGVLQRQPQ